MVLNCVDENAGEHCDECGTIHREIKALPERPLTYSEAKELTKGRAISGIVPIFRIHDDTEDGYYIKSIPSIVAIIDSNVLVLWNNPRTDKGWLVVEENQDIEEPFLYARILGKLLRDSAYQEDTIKGFEVIQKDTQLPEIDVSDAKRAIEANGGLEE